MFSMLFIYLLADVDCDALVRAPFTQVHVPYGGAGVPVCESVQPQDVRDGGYRSRSHQRDAGR